MSMSTLCRFTLAGKCWKSADAVEDSAFGQRVLRRRAPMAADTRLRLNLFEDETTGWYQHDLSSRRKIAASGSLRGAAIGSNGFRVCFGTVFPLLATGRFSVYILLSLRKKLSFLKHFGLQERTEKTEQNGGTQWKTSKGIEGDIGQKSKAIASKHRHASTPETLLPLRGEGSSKLTDKVR